MTDLDPVIHAPTRLRIMVALAALPPGGTLNFSRLQELLDLTAGNLITHLRRLETAGYVVSRKSGRVTTVELSDSGRASFAIYRRALRSLLAEES